MCRFVIEAVVTGILTANWFLKLFSLQVSLRRHFLGHISSHNAKLISSNTADLSYTESWAIFDFICLLPFYLEFAAGVKDRFYEHPSWAVLTADLCSVLQCDCHSESLAIRDDPGHPLELFRLLRCTSPCISCCCTVRFIANWLEAGGSFGVSTQHAWLEHLGGDRFDVVDHPQHNDVLHRTPLFHLLPRQRRLRIL